MAERAERRRAKDAAPQGAGIGENAAERLAAADALRRARWDVLLVWFMRLAALAWLAKGILNWAQIIGALPNAPAFDDLPIGREAALVYFGVIDCVAAVGLWLAGSWGGVIWLFAATSALILGVLAPDLAPLSVAGIALCASSIVVYFVLSWAVARETR